MTEITSLPTREVDTLSRSVAATAALATLMNVSPTTSEGKVDAASPKAIVSEDRALPPSEDSWKNHRRAGRAIALEALAPIEGELAEVRRRLALKRLRGELSVGEAQQLRMVQWKLDRLDDARGGEGIDAFEELVQVHASMASMMDRYAKEIKAAGLPTANRRHRR